MFRGSRQRSAARFARTDIGCISVAVSDQHRKTLALPASMLVRGTGIEPVSGASAVPGCFAAVAQGAFRGVHEKAAVGVGGPGTARTAANGRQPLLFPGGRRLHSHPAPADATACAAHRSSIPAAGPGGQIGDHGTTCRAFFCPLRALRGCRATWGFDPGGRRGRTAPLCLSFRVVRSAPATL